MFFISRNLTRELSRLFFRITHSKKITIYLLALFFLPGTFIHELSHFIMAKTLFVPAGKLNLFPEPSGNEIKLGSVSIAKTDPFRRFLIGGAPLLIGTLIILSSLYITEKNNLSGNIYFLIILGYTIFEIGNTMFASKKDMEGSILLFIILIIFLILIYFFNIYIPVKEFFSTPLVITVFQKGNFFLLPALTLDLLLIFILKIINK